MTRTLHFLASSSRSGLGGKLEEAGLGWRSTTCMHLASSYRSSSYTLGKRPARPSRHFYFAVRARSQLLEISVCAYCPRIVNISGSTASPAVGIYFARLCRPGGSRCSEARRDKTYNRDEYKVDFSSVVTIKDTAGAFITERAVDIISDVIILISMLSRVYFTNL